MSAQQQTKQPFMSDIAIRGATPADAAVIGEIFGHHVRHGVATFETIPPDEAEMTARIERVLGAGWPWLVAMDPAGEIIGYAYAAQLNARHAYRYTCEDSVYLRHDRLGEGIGTALLGALLKAAEAAGCRQMVALIAGTEGASVALHTRHGFEMAGRWRSVGRKHGRWLDVVSMQRALGSGDTAPPAQEP
jgi:phosphinothricin acetyltransferase